MAYRLTSFSALLFGPQHHRDDDEDDDSTDKDCGCEDHYHHLRRWARRCSTRIFFKVVGLRCYCQPYEVNTDQFCVTYIPQNLLLFHKYCTNSRGLCKTEQEHCEREGFCLSGFKLLSPPSPLFFPWFTDGRACFTAFNGDSPCHAIFTGYGPCFTAFNGDSPCHAIFTGYGPCFTAFNGDSPCHAIFTGYGPCFTAFSGDSPCHAIFTAYGPCFTAFSGDSPCHAILTGSGPCFTCTAFNGDNPNHAILLAAVLASPTASVA